MPTSKPMKFQPSLQLLMPGPVHQTSEFKTNSKELDSTKPPRLGAPTGWGWNDFRYVNGPAAGKVVIFQQRNDPCE